MRLALWFAFGELRNYAPAGRFVTAFHSFSPLEVPVETAGKGVESESASRLTFVLDVDLAGWVEYDVQTNSDFYAVAWNVVT